MQCRLWDIIGIPCKHAIAGINQFGYNPEDYVHEAYSKDTFLRCYKNLLKPMHVKDDWPKTGNSPLLPPEVTRLPGRPKKSRRRKPDEAPNGSKLKTKQTTIKCSKCGNEGHNKRKCRSHGKGHDTSQGSVKTTSRILLLKKWQLQVTPSQFRPPLQSSSGSGIGRSAKLPIVTDTTRSTYPL
ncbi:hypothetical protein MRB53_026512 [Persea americana]|uniref:Uncharacterized protein n=1 Tax=Persea americana TaxID=3435 RepID=A0ACC2LI90_PERAE|nr:hypothetical protein MRB53_026512 [Persea americana]